MKPRIDWHHNGFTSQCGLVYPDAMGEWVGKVALPNGRYGRIRETFVSAEVAKGVVERTWKRERGEK